MPACAGLPALNATCTPEAVLRRWHVTTQELLIRHLRTVWPDDRPRVMVDLGSHAGHGVGRNVSDAMLWLDHFGRDGKLSARQGLATPVVLGVDAFEDYALDLQHRFDATSPYVGMRHVLKRSVHAALGVWNPKTHVACHAPAAGDDEATNGSCIDLGWSMAYTALMCTRTDWFDDYERMDRHSASDHVCRITRQRAGLSPSRLPLPASARGYRLDTNPKSAKYLAPAARVDALLSRELGPTRRIDFLKADYDVEWPEVIQPGGLLELLRSRRVAVMTLEMDVRTERQPWRRFEELACAAHAADYALLLKVPCAGNGVWQDRVFNDQGATSYSHAVFHPLGQRAAYMPISHRYRALLSETWGVRARASQPCAVGGQHCVIQDLLLLDLRMPELRKLIALGNAECGTSFPLDVVPAWASAERQAAEREARIGGASALPSPPAMTLLGEREILRPSLWQDPLPKTPRRARRLPDGSFSCRLAAGWDASESAKKSAAELPPCRT